ncbi:uncharacterized protein LOC142320380 [Lycorma delicatula]|uniref:uncharacterized protein LOC142320380 n=1 Tax=Lycorma delicatula TaxID=130591 RepID=UPI003F51904D
MEIILNCHHLENLKLFNSNVFDPILTDEIVVEIFQTLQSSLKSLTLDCTYLSSSSYSAIFHCKWLEDLHVINAVTFSGRQLNTFPKLLQLKSLKIEKGIGLNNDDFIETFNSNNKTLQNLICFALTYCFNLEDSGLEAIVKVCGKNLISLNIEGCSKLTNNATDNIVKYCNNLRYLNVAFISNKNLLDYEMVPNNFPHLNVLVIDDSADYTELRALQIIMANLEIVISEVKLFKCLHKFN